MVAKRQYKYDFETVKRAANGQWESILLTEGGGVFTSENLDGRKEHPCPKPGCGGATRFRFTNKDGDGSVLCSHRGRDIGDGFGALRWAHDRTDRKGFPWAIELVANRLNLSPNPVNNSGKKNPLSGLAFSAVRDQDAVREWCEKKGGIKPEAVAAIGAEVAMWKQHPKASVEKVIAIPGRRGLAAGAAPTRETAIGWQIAKVSGEKFEFKDREPLKIRSTTGSESGIVTDWLRLKSATVVWKLEGPTDLMAFLSLPDLPSNVTAWTNSGGATESPKGWMLDTFIDRELIVCQDCDEPGQRGAVRWAGALSNVASGKQCKNVVLPYAISKDHGKDLRDWIKDGGTYAALMDLASAAGVVQPSEKPSAGEGGGSYQVNEATEDPHRLAREIISKFALQTSGGKFGFYKQQWYEWLPENGCWKFVPLSDMQARVNADIKVEFNEAYLCRMLAKQSEGSERGDENDDDKEDEEIFVMKVSRGLVSNVLAAMESECIISHSIEFNRWLVRDGKYVQQEERPLIAMRNGLLNIDLALAGNDKAEYLTNLSPDWWSTICLPYDADENAQCPLWMEFLKKNLDGDEERISILQEYAGYCLTSDTGVQQFLILEGNGANGKSVYCAMLRALLGEDNCSAVPLELIGERFQGTRLLGKLANIVGDAGEIDRLAEGTLKSLVSGDKMYFDRKNLDGVDAVPTAKMVIACNNLPRFNDKTGGMARRILLVPFLTKITEEERIPNMDKSWWWTKSGEMQGIFNWALFGLSRLREQGRFTASSLCKQALEDYRDDLNPARMFLRDHFVFSLSHDLPRAHVYFLYEQWCKAHGYRALASRGFGKELKNWFEGKILNAQVGPRNERVWVYRNLTSTCDRICGHEVRPGSIA